MAAKNNISGDILEHIIDSGSEKVSIDNDSFWTTIVSGDKKIFRKRTARIIGLSFVAIAVVSFVVYSAIFYIQNVLLFKADLHINQFGTLIRKSYNSEYAMFVYDPAEPWAASGIQVQKKDLMFISASGAYHTNFTGLIDATKNNFWADRREYWAIQSIESLDKDIKTIYRYVYMTTPPTGINPHKPYRVDKKNIKVERPRHLKDTALFGDVLLQIVPECEMRNTDYLDPNRIYALPRMRMNKKETVRIKDDGVLTFGVNDNKPANNIGQILVVMENYRYQKRKTAALNMFKGKMLDYPYFWYDYLKHKGCYWLWTPLWNALLVLWFILFVTLEYGLLCAFVYILPFLFLKETWKDVQAYYRKSIIPKFVKQ